MDFYYYDGTRGPPVPGTVRAQIAEHCSFRNQIWVATLGPPNPHNAAPRGADVGPTDDSTSFMTFRRWEDRLTETKPGDVDRLLEEIAAGRNPMARVARSDDFVALGLIR